MSKLSEVLAPQRNSENQGFVVYIIDEFFKDGQLEPQLKPLPTDRIIYANVNDHEPTTAYINQLTPELRDALPNIPCALVGIGGGSAMDIAKAISNLMTNGGQAEDYQGWDLVKQRGVFKVGIPTISGTGAETTRTCVMTSATQKLGMNSDFTMFDQVILDPSLLATVPKDKEFYSGMDCYIHCIESLRGRTMNEFSKAFAEKSIELCREVFLNEMDHEKLMVASYLGGASVAMTMVGVIHPVSAGLSKVLGIRHGLANCIVCNVAEDYYPEAVTEFRQMLEKSQITLPKITATEEQLEKMVDECCNHTKPLWNALGDDWSSILTRDKIKELYYRMQ